MRAVLMQHLIKTVLERLQKMMETPSSRSTAVSLGWLTEDEKAVTGLRWNQETRTHVRDEQIQPIDVQEVKAALEELVVLVKEPMVVARYHATRPLSEQYQSPNLTMLMEIRLRTEQSHQAWRHLYRLKQSAVWVAAGAFVRQERIQRSPCPETGCLDQVLGLMLGNKGKYCYTNAVIRGLLHGACWLGGLESLFEGAMLGFLQGMLRSDGVTHVWANLFWRAQMGNWRAPARQHDAAEFLQHVLGRLTYTVEKLVVVWEARQPRDHEWLRTDGGQAAPWLLQPPLPAGGNRPLREVTVQNMVENWHHQDCTCCDVWAKGPCSSGGQI